MPDYKALFCILYRANRRAIRMLKAAQKEMEDMAMQATDPAVILRDLDMEDEPPTFAAIPFPAGEEPPIPIE